LLSGVAALSSSAALASCAKVGGPAVSLWAMDVEGENAARLLPDIERATGFAVNLQWLAWSAAHEKLLTAFAGGSLPDVIMLARPWIAEFSTIGAISPLPPDRAGLLADAFAPHDLRIAGRDMAVPWTLDLAVQYYRTDVLARAGYAAPPTEWSDWLAMLRAVKRVQGDGYAVLMQVNYPDHLFRIAEQQPEPMLRDNQSRGNFASPGFKAALRLYKSLFDERLAPLVSSIEASDPVAELGRGWVAIYPSGSWIRAELLRRRSLIARHLWAVGAMPGPVGGALSSVRGAALCVSATARDTARAWELVHQLTTPRAELQLTHIAGTLPSRPSAWGTLLSDPTLRPFRAALDRPLPSRNLVEWERIGDDVQLVAEQVVRGHLTIDAGTAEMDRRVDAILAKRRWLLERGRVQ
jgi:multiple sugar transport system substrate-binding protein